MTEHLNTGSKRLLIFLACSLCILILLGGYLYFRYETNIIRKDKYNELKAIAELKINQITQWRKERLGDANVFYKSAFFERSIEQFLINDFNADLKNEIREQLSIIKTQSGYENIFITSPAGKVLFSLDPALKTVDTITNGFITEAAFLQKVIITDLYYCHLHNKIHYDIMVPFTNRNNISIAILVFRVDPNEYLYPLIQSWPTPSRSSEILIVRKNGDSVLFLNELRHRTHTALSFQLPLTSITIAAVKAVLGYQGIWEGNDYRNVEVLSYVCKVPGTPWYMVAKVDRSEIFSELSYRAGYIMIFTIVLIILIAVAISRFYFLRQSNIYRELFLKEKDLAQTQEEYQTTLYSIGDGVVIADKTGIIRNMNPVAGQLIGWNESDAKGRILGEVFRIVNEKTNTRVDIPIERVLKEGVVERLPDQSLIISTTGMKTPIAGNCSPIIHENQQINSVVFVFRDQTAEREANKKLNQTNTELERSNKELEQFAYVASHDLQEPLRMVASFTQLLYKRYNNVLGKDADEFIHYIVDGANRMQRLIQDLLSYSRINTRSGSFNPVDSHLALGEAISNLQVAIIESGAIITNEDLPLIIGDHGQIVQVFQNLIGNAIKFHSEEKPRIHISAKLEKGEWIFSMKDNGIGIETQFFDKIFLIFQRLHAGNQYPGTGIGLAICHRIIQRHEGRIWVESEPGKGSVFYFSFHRIDNSTIHRDGNSSKTH
ncbi:MAG: ATP-binding protein [Bacteroidetes bacterium]|nr:ATP-binding protein [Bacteroidota bacterium]